MNIVSEIVPSLEILSINIIDKNKFKLNQLKKSSGNGPKVLDFGDS